MTHPYEMTLDQWLSHPREWETPPRTVTLNEWRAANNYHNYLDDHGDFRHPNGISKITRKRIEERFRERAASASEGARIYNQLLQENKLPTVIEKHHIMADGLDTDVQIARARIYHKRQVYKAHKQGLYLKPEVIANYPELERIKVMSRIAYYLPETPDANGHFFPSVVKEGEAGHNPTNWDYGTVRDVAQQCVDRLNNKLGLTTKDVDEIISSSMAAQIRRDTSNISYPIEAWNTNKPYGENGQRIAAQQLPTGHVAFVDVDRNINGITNDIFPGGDDYSIKQHVQTAYDYGEYSEGIHVNNKINGVLSYLEAKQICDNLVKAAYACSAINKDKSECSESIENLKMQVEKIIKDRFPDSFFSAKTSTLGGEHRPGICFHFAIGKDSTQWPNHIIHNDRGHNQIWVNCKKNIETGEIKDLELTGSIIGYRDKTTFKGDKLGWRDIKKPTNIAGVVKALTKYFDKMKEAENGIKKPQGVSL